MPLPSLRKGSQLEKGPELRCGTHHCILDQRSVYLLLFMGMEARDLVANINEQKAWTLIASLGKTRWHSVHVISRSVAGAAAEAFVQNILLEQSDMTLWE